MKQKLMAIVVIFLAMVAHISNAQKYNTYVNVGPKDVYAAGRAHWLDMAEGLKPALVHRILTPRAVVAAVNDTAVFQHWRYDSTGTPEDMLYNRSLKDVKKITLDFGRHMTGYFTFRTRTLFRCQDAPVRIKFFFGELPAELNTPLNPWKGSLSRAWMQDEVVTVTEVDRSITIPRRMACRYVTIELLGASNDFDFGIDSVWFDAVSSAGEITYSPQTVTDVRMGRIRDVGVETLRECMQTVFEDGPKRDRRLWVGDLYLQSLANRYSFRNFDLVKRCLYLFAALSTEDGIVISNIFESPEPHPQDGSICLSYSLLWNSTLLEYLKDTNDMVSGLDLWPVAKRQIEVITEYVGEDGIFDMSKTRGMWTFFDWREGLDLTTPMQGAVIFALDQSAELARMLGYEHEAKDWGRLLKKMKKAAIKNMYDSKRGVFVSGKNRQVSALGQAWMIKSGVVKDDRARRALTAMLADSNAVQPGTPYGMHYLIDAMIMAGMTDEARTMLVDYWGGMVDRGADTFWESYDPNDDFISAYGFSPVNSACHAWSCTPIYFINRYPEIFGTNQ